MDSSAKRGGHGGLLDGLAQSWVRVAGPGDVLGARSILHGQAGLGNQLADVGTNHVDAEDLIRRGVSQELNEALGIVYTKKER